MSEERPTPQEFAGILAKAIADSMPIPPFDWRANFASCALNGYIASNRDIGPKEAAERAVQYADALMEALGLAP